MLEKCVLREQQILNFKKTFRRQEREEKTTGRMDKVDK